MRFLALVTNVMTNECTYLTQTIEVARLFVEANMDLSKLRAAYESGPGLIASKEDLFAVVLASHLSSFQRIFCSQLANYRAVIWDKQANNKLELRGHPHVVLMMQLEAVRKDKPDHAALTNLHHKEAFTRLQKGAHSVCLQSGGRVNGFVELWIERKDKTTPEPAIDNEDMENGDSSSKKLLTMFAEEKCYGQRRYRS